MSPARAMLPPDRPRMSDTAVRALLASHHVDLSLGPVLLGVRGYYRDTMGAAGANDRGLYDDAAFLVTEDAVLAYNFNTDPSAPDRGTKLATLVPGTYWYRWGTHHPNSPAAYRCLVQDGYVTVRRDDGRQEVGEFYIHIHRGGITVTSSEGCQTVPPNQYDRAFVPDVDRAMREAGVERIRYVLVDAEPGVSTP